MNCKTQINPHLWRKFDQAQKNYNRHFNGVLSDRRQNRKAVRRRVYWARQFNRWKDKLTSAFGRNFNNL